MRRQQRLQTPTFAQTVVMIQTMPLGEWRDVEAIIQRHLALGFTYHKDQIYRAQDALLSPARRWDHIRRRSGSSRTSTRR